MMKNIRYGTIATLVLSLFLLTACGNKAEETVSSSAPSSSQVASTSSSSSTVSSKPSASKQASRPSQSRVASAVSSSQDTVASSEASSAVETSSSPAAVTEVSSAPVAQGAVAPDQPAPAPEAPVATVNQSAPVADTPSPEVTPPAPYEPQAVSPGAAAGQWGNITINSDGTMTGVPYVVTNVTQGDSGILYMNATTSGPYALGIYYHFYPAGVPIPFENFADPTDISRDRLISGNGNYLSTSADAMDNLEANIGLTYRQ